MGVSLAADDGRLVREDEGAWGRMKTRAAPGEGGERVKRIY